MRDARVAVRRGRTLALLVAVGTLLATGRASANSGGLAGYTGKPNVSEPNGSSCNNCHGGGTAPTLNLMGPAQLNAGQSAEYTLVVTTGQPRASAAIAATDGVVLTPVSGVRDSFGEMVPNGSIAASGTASFRFRVTAPATGNAIKLWFVGLASNGNGTGGDRAMHGIRDVTIVGGAAPSGTGTSSGGTPMPTAPSGGTVDAGANAAAPGSGSGMGTGTGTGSGSGTGTGTGTDIAQDQDATESTESEGAPTRATRGMGTPASAAACALGGVAGGANLPAGLGLGFGFALVGLLGLARRRSR